MPTTGPGAGPFEAPAGPRLFEALGCGPAKGPKAAHNSNQDCTFNTGETILGYVKVRYIVDGVSNSAEFLGCRRSTLHQKSDLVFDRANSV